jgi:hypothetical protein
VHIPKIAFLHALGVLLGHDGGLTVVQHEHETFIPQGQSVLPGRLLLTALLIG